jgi:putative spermidine/putrescine transport system substrate-binding protein
LWDFRQYPGKRALRDVPQGNIELALIASGMSKEDVADQLYVHEDLGLLDQAFEKLDEIRDNIIWWESGNQIQRELEGSRVILAATWNGRVWAATKTPLTAPKDKPDVRLTYNDAVLDYDWWIIPKGSKNPRLAAELVSSLYAHPEGASRFADALGYGPPIRGWESLLPHNPSLVQQMPTTEKNMNQQLMSNPDFWAKYYTEISERWRLWRAK